MTAEAASPGPSFLLGARGQREPVLLPPGWDLQQVLFAEPRSVLGQPGELLNRALAEPLGGAHLDRLLGPGTRVAVVVDDLTRSTPVRELLPPLLERIEAAGTSRDAITIVIGCGTHPPMAGEELERHLGPDVTASFRVENHDARAADLVPLGELAGHGPVRFNATVARADVKITVGSIVPHVHNGFGGGPKNVMPAICDYDTVRHHHLKNMLHPGARPGVVDGNPFLADVSQIAEFLGVDFTVQCLRDSVGHVHEVLAGEPGAVRRTGVALQTDCLGVPVGRKSDVTIVSSYPYDHGIQFLKGLMPAALVTATNGSILLVTRATAPLPTAFLDAVRAVRGSGGIEAESRLLATLARREAPIPDCAMDFNMAVILLFAIARRFRTTIVGPEALRTAAEAMDYEYCADLETALCRTKQQQPRASVQVIPAGGYVFPMTEEPFLLFGQGEPPRRPIPGKEAR